ncbi:MAG: type II toxin-antitoxin system BrnA family antitoxin [Chloroflexota bacterium]
MKASEFDKKFDANENVLDELDLNSARRPAQGQKRVNVDFPIWMITALDREARRMGVTRQSIIKMWLAERLQQSR